MVFDKVDREVDEAREIKSIEPDNRLIIPTLLISTLLAVVMPVPSGRDNDVTRLHRNSLAVNCSEATSAFDDESACEGGVPVCRCCFLRLHQLESSIQSISSIWCG